MRFTIDRFENDRAVLRSDDGQELIVPRIELAADITEGTVVNAHFFTDTENGKTRIQQTRDVLNELLGGSKEKI
ncbi:MAG: DUF3006 domain-containing protein [Candidatus Uhrbacteria bacterium]